ncbi:MAG: hypothetical protein FD165_1746 [Gammaproteobacteria bacterium]|nr:MAG: hypothetical protein FD165_1746 [Gammaproteobacteria bacterium]TND04317.1 MAG: hypothetical protein FD120_1431 [Gammaproteobacteria bacterium]
MTIPRIQTILLACLVVLPTFAAYAVEADNLYDAEIPVTGQGTAERAEPLKAALAEVVVKVTGDRKSATHPKLALTIERAGDFVQQYRYQAVAAQPAADPRNPLDPVYTHVMHVDFDAKAVNKALRDAGFPVWGRVRPLTVAWIAVQEPAGKRYIVGADTSPEWRGPVLDRAARRGIPLLVPAMDLEDQLAISFADVWAAFQHNLVEASRRYQADAVLVGRVRQDAAAGWQVTWGFYQGGNSDQWESSGVTRSAALVAGVDKAADLLGVRFSKVFGLAENDSVRLRVSDIHALDDYARVTRYLVSLDTVASLQVTRVEPSSVLFDLIIQSSREGLRQTIALGNVLVADGARANAAATDAGGVPAASEEMAYRLLP